MAQLDKKRPNPPNDIDLDRDLQVTETFSDEVAKAARDFQEVSLTALTPGADLPADLFLPKLIREKNRVVMIRIATAGAILRRKLCLQIQEAGFTAVFIHNSHMGNVLPEMNAQTKKLLDRPTVSMEEKARAIFQNAHHLVVHAMRQPHLGQSLEYGREYINNVVEFVRKNPNCLKQLHEVLAMDYSLFNHSVNVCLLLISFAHHRKLNSGQMIFLGLGGLFHDIGKREIPEGILNKPGPLTPEEWEEMRRHPAKGVELLREAGHLPPETFQIVYQHHENLDGSGYPRGLPGEKITVPGRLIRIVDAYDALTSRRCYQQAVPATTALTVMAKEMQNLLDQELLGSFIKFLGMVTKH